MPEPDRSPRRWARGMRRQPPHAHLEAIHKQNRHGSDARHGGLRVLPYGTKRERPGHKVPGALYPTLSYLLQRRRSCFASHPSPITIKPHAMFTTTSLTNGFSIDFLRIPPGYYLSPGESTSPGPPHPKHRPARCKVGLFAANNCNHSVNWRRPPLRRRASYDARRGAAPRAHSPASQTTSENPHSR